MFCSKGQWDALNGKHGPEAQKEAKKINDEILFSLFLGGCLVGVAVFVFAIYLAIMLAKM